MVRCRLLAVGTLLFFIACVDDSNEPDMLLDSAQGDDSGDGSGDGSGSASGNASGGSDADDDDDRDDDGGSSSSGSSDGSSQDEGGDDENDDDDGGTGQDSSGYESDLDLVLEGDTVPGNVELGLASDPETPRNPGGNEEEQRCFDLINDERANMGLDPFKWDGDLVDLARSHADDMQQLGYFGHGSSTNSGHLYQERGDFLGLKDGKFSSVVENAASGYPDAAAVVAGWMSSSGHRAVILGEGYWDSLTHIGCAKSGEGNAWNAEFGAR